MPRSSVGMVLAVEVGVGVDVRIHYKSVLEYRAWILLDWVLIVVWTQIYGDVVEQGILVLTLSLLLS